MVMNAREEKNEKELLMMQNWMEINGNTGVDIFSLLPPMTM